MDILLQVLGGVLLLGALIIGGLVVTGDNHLSKPGRPAKSLRRPKAVRHPVKRYKHKMRGIGVGTKVEDLGIVYDENGQPYHALVGRDRKHYVRFYPNPGFTILGWHWCRKGRHDGPVRKT